MLVVHRSIFSALAMAEAFCVHTYTEKSEAASPAHLPPL